MKLRFLLYVSISSFLACKTSQLPLNHTFPIPVDTHDHTIELQTKRTLIIDAISCSNEFNAARMNDFSKINDSTYRVTILPENEPINESPHYAFVLNAKEKRTINLELYYGKYKHRYYPKLSYDKLNWTAIDSMAFDTLKAGNLANLKLDVGPYNLYVAAEEIKDSEHTKNWMSTLAKKHPQIKVETIGHSKLGRELLFMDIAKGLKKEKPTIIILSRAHPPEISGYMAMESFVEELLRNSPLSLHFLNKYRVMVYPLLNPDGVDLGHWRHNASGIDLNRDWATYNQAEIKAITHHLVRSVVKNKNKVILGLDFHSTQEDVIYTHTDNRRSKLFPFKDLWIQALSDDAIVLNPNEEAYDLGKPMTKGWFYLQFGAEGIIYEVGDETDRAFLKYKAEVAAREMMKLLVMRD